MLANALVLCLLAAPAFAFQPQAPPKGAIEGQVLNLKTGVPLKRAIVRLVSAALNPAGAMSRAPLMLNKETDEQGRFAFTNLDSGKYFISAERAGFLRRSYGAKKHSGGGEPVLLGEGQTAKSIDFKLPPQGVITGKVLDEDGEPVANVQVRAQKSVSRNGKQQWSVAANATASDIGEYRLPGLQPGSYVVVASARNPGLNMASTPAAEPLPDKPEMTYAATCYPSTPDSAAAIPVEVGEGGEVPHIDVRLVKTQVFRVRGRVAGIAEATAGRAIMPVTLTPRDGSPGGMQTLMGQARGPEGVFEIRNVPPGQYVAHAQSQANGRQYAAVADVDVIGSHVEGLVLNLETGADVQGSVKIVDTDSPLDLKNLQVLLRPVAFGGPAPRARVGEDLKFTLKGVPPVRYAVTVTGYPDTCYVKSIQYGGADVSPEGVLMTRGGVLDIVISAGAAQVDAVVLTGEGKAAIGAQVLILKDGAPLQSRSADENGLLSIKGLKPGDYQIIAWEDVDPNQLFDTAYLSKFGNDAKSVKLEAAAHEAVQLKAIPPE